MSLREAAQQALEALEERYVGALRDKAMDALRTALAEPEQEPVACVTGAYAGHFTVVPTNPALVLTTGMALYTHPVDDTALLRRCLNVLLNACDPKADIITALRERLALSDAALLAPKPGQLKDRGKK